MVLLFIGANSANKLFICVSEYGHYLNLIATGKRGGYVVYLETEYFNTTGMCVELFFWPIAEVNSYHRPIISVATVTEEKDKETLVMSTGYELATWNRLFVELPDGVHQVVVTARRSESGQSGMSIDDIVVQPCEIFGKTRC